MPVVNVQKGGSRGEAGDEAGGCCSKLRSRCQHRVCEEDFDFCYRVKIYLGILLILVLLVVPYIIFLALVANDYIHAPQFRLVDKEQNQANFGLAACMLVGDLVAFADS